MVAIITWVITTQCQLPGWLGISSVIIYFCQSFFYIMYNMCLIFTILSTMAGDTYGIWVAYPFGVHPCSLMGSMFFIFYFSVFFCVHINYHCWNSGPSCSWSCGSWFTGRWFSPGFLGSSNNKTDTHDIAELFLEVASNTITLNPNPVGIFIETLNDFSFEPYNRYVRIVWSFYDKWQIRILYLRYTHNLMGHL